MSEALLTELAERFWSAAGGADAEADFVDLIPLSLPLAVITLPALSIARMQEWLERSGTVVSLHRADRRLRGGLIAHRGRGIVLVDGADREDERRFTLAHEVGHFLIDYLHPRERAVRLLGDAIADVLDGLRPATSTERIDATLAACPMGVYVDLLERDGDRGVASSMYEARANRLAWELLAPAGELVAAGLRGADAGVLERHLQERHRLPAAQATAYARCLLREWGRPPTFLEWLSP